MSWSDNATVCTKCREPVLCAEAVRVKVPAVYGGKPDRNKMIDAWAHPRGKCVKDTKGAKQ